MNQTACGRKCGNIVGRAWSGHVGPRSDQSDLVVVDAQYWGGGGERGYVLVTSPLARQISRNDDKLHSLADAGEGPAVCSSLHCGTRYLLAVLAQPTAQVPRWAGSVSGRPGSIHGRLFGVLVYTPSGVARQSHCIPALLSIV